MSTRLRVALLVLAVGLGNTTPVRADVTASVLGVVTDPSGAAVPGAAVTLRNPNNGLERKATTDTTGSYEFLRVAVGENYSVEVEANDNPSFRSLVGYIDRWIQRLG